jgi:hypothetical protein
LFYELFQFDPQSLIQLLKLNLEGQYAFESITIKTTKSVWMVSSKGSMAKGQIFFSKRKAMMIPKSTGDCFEKFVHFMSKETIPSRS